MSLKQRFGCATQLITVSYQLSELFLVFSLQYSMVIHSSDNTRPAMESRPALESAQAILSRLECLRSLHGLNGTTSSTMVVAPVRMPASPSIPIIRPTTPHPTTVWMDQPETPSAPSEFVTPILPLSKRAKRSGSDDTVIITGPHNGGKILTQFTTPFCVS